MKRLTLLVTAMMVMMAGLLITSCQPKEEAPEEPALTLSTVTVAVPNEGGAAAAITVTTNQPKWQAIAGADWLKTTQQGNNLVITALPNPGTADRTAEVGVYAGAATAQKVTVTQTAADIVLEVSPEELVIPNSGATKLVRVKSNTAKWQLDTGDAEWIASTSFSDFVELTFAPNKSEARTAKLYAKSGTQTKEIVVKQVGTGNINFFLPMMNQKPEVTSHQLITYEQQQGSILVSFNPPYSGWLGKSGAVYQFVSSSPYFPSFGYMYNYDTSYMEVVQYISNGDLKSIEDSGYIQFLKENGFEVTFDDKAKVYQGENKKTKYTLLIGTANTGKAVAQFIAPGPEQPQAYPTFETFPYSKVEWLDNLEYSADKIAEVEKADGGEAKRLASNPEKPTELDVLQVLLAAKAHPAYIRMYFLDLETKDPDTGKPYECATELLAVWNKVSLGAWEVVPGKGYFLLTNEFKALMKEAGFEFFRNVRGNDYYYNKSKKLMVVPKGARFTDVNDGAPAFVINYFHFEEKETSMDAFVERIAKRVEAIDRILGRK